MLWKWYKWMWLNMQDIKSGWHESYLISLRRWGKGWWFGWWSVWYTKLWSFCLLWPSRLVYAVRRVKTDYIEYCYSTSLQHFQLVAKEKLQKQTIWLKTWSTPKSTAHTHEHPFINISERRFLNRIRLPDFYNPHKQRSWPSTVSKPERRKLADGLHRATFDAFWSYEKGKLYLILITYILEKLRNTYVQSRLF